MHPPTMQHAGCGFGGSSAVIAGDSTVAQLWALWVAPIVGDVLVRSFAAFGESERWAVDRPAARSLHRRGWVSFIRPGLAVEPPSG